MLLPPYEWGVELRAPAGCILGLGELHVICTHELREPVLWLNAGCSPEFLCQEDDPSLQNRRGKDPKDLLRTEKLQKGLKLHVFQPGVQGPCEFNELLGRREDT